MKEINFLYHICIIHTIYELLLQPSVMLYILTVWGFNMQPAYPFLARLMTYICSIAGVKLFCYGVV